MRADAASTQSALSLLSSAKRFLPLSFSELRPVSTSSQEPMHQWSRRGALQSGVTGPGSQTQYLSTWGVIPGTSFRSPEGNAKAVCEPPVCTANWHTCPGRAAHRKVTVCWALAAVARQIGAAMQSAVDRSRFFMAFPCSLFHHHPFGTVLLEDQAYGVNDLLVVMGLAVFDHLVFDFAALLVVHVVLVTETVVPAAIPGHQLVGVPLIGVGELGAGQLLHVDETVGVYISRETDRVGLRRADHRHRRQARKQQEFLHVQLQKLLICAVLRTASE